MSWAGWVPSPNLHPYKNSHATGVGTIGPAYETLLAYRFDPGFDFRIDFEVRPMLAERWEQPDRTTYVFHLRRGVKWHDGEELTAQDVVYSYDYARDPRNAFPVVTGQLTQADKIEAPDRYTVRITTRRPIATFLESLADLSMYILPKHVADRGDDFTRVTIGSGPYKVGSFNPSGSSVFVKNPDYWQAGKPYVDRLEVLWGVDDSAKLASFVAGKNDLYTAADRRQFEPVLKAKPGIEFVQRRQDVGVGLLPKLDQPPFNDIRIRKAVHLTVDRQDLNNALAFGEGTINPPGVPGFKTGWSIPQEELLQLPGYRKPKEEDLAEARRLLAEAGHTDGFKTTALYPSGGVVMPRVAEAMSGQLKKLGIELVLDPRDNATSKKREVAGEYEAIITPLGYASLKSALPDHLHSRGSLNKIGLSDPKLDALLDAIPATFEVDKRKQVALELQRYLLEQVYFVPTIELTAYATWQPWVHGYNPSVNWVVVIAGQDTVNTLWLEQEKMPADRR